MILWMAALIRQAVRELIDEQILRDERSCWTGITRGRSMRKN